MTSKKVQYTGDMQDAYNEGYVDGWTDSNDGDMNKPSNLIAVVFCKDCKWLEDKSKKAPRTQDSLQDRDLIGTCDRFGMYVKEMDYCSRGSIKR